MRLALMLIFLSNFIQAQSPDSIASPNIESGNSVAQPIIYMLAGLGLDPRAFEKLKFHSDTVYYLDWIEPLPHEKIAHYAKRLIELQMDSVHQKGPIILIGHSFGGVMMQEIAQQLGDIQKVILISSIHSQKEKPASLRHWGWMPIYWTINKGMIKGSFPLWAKKYGYKTKESRQLFRSMVSRFSNRYHRWATRSIARWRPTPYPKNIPIIRIHGNKDRMFPIKRIAAPDYIVEGGNHFMIWEDAEALSKVLGTLY